MDYIFVFVFYQFSGSQVRKKDEVVVEEAQAENTDRQQADGHEDAGADDYALVFAHLCKLGIYY